MGKTDLLAIGSPGSRALKNSKYGRYCRLRASAQPRIAAYREAGWETSDDENAYSNACRLERRAGVRERIKYLSHQKEELIAEKRRRIEEQLWNIHEADIGDYFETHDIDGKTSNNQNAFPTSRLKYANTLRKQQLMHVVAPCRSCTRSWLRAKSCARCWRSAELMSAARFRSCPIPSLLPNCLIRLKNWGSTSIWTIVLRSRALIRRPVAAIQPRCATRLHLI